MEGLSSFMYGAVGGGFVATASSRTVLGDSLVHQFGRSQTQIDSLWKTFISQLPPNRISPHAHQSEAAGTAAGGHNVPAGIACRRQVCRMIHERGLLCRVLSLRHCVRRRLDSLVSEGRGVFAV